MHPKILVIRFGSLGDIILTSAAILNLKIAYPFSRISLLTKSKHASIAEKIPGVDEIIATGNSPRIGEFLNLLFELEKKNFDIIVDLQSNARSMLARKLITAAQKVVYNSERPERNRIVRLKDFPSKITHSIDKYNECLTQLNHYPVAKRPALEISPDIKPISKMKQVVIAPGASFSNKQWPIKNFSEVALELSAEQEIHIIWAVTSDDSDKVNMEEKLGAEYVTKLTDCPIDKLAEIIHQSELCIANDSGIAHLSSAVGTPVIAIFGPTHSALGFAPRGIFDQVIEVDEYCRPCSLHGDKPCFRSERFCFTRINSTQVYESAVELLNQRKNIRPALFVDRDGTVIVDKPFDSNPDNIEFESGSINALKSAQSAGFKIIIVSNQSGIARGYFKFEDAEKFNKELIRQLEEAGVKDTAIYFCPHYANGSVPEYSYHCNCRKPSAGMVEKAVREHNIDLRKSYVVGDKTDDFNLGRVTGMKPFLVKTGQGEKYIDKIRNISENPDYDICSNLFEAVERILEAGKNQIGTVRAEN